MSVKRWQWAWTGYEDGEMEEFSAGAYVLASDYDRVVAECEALRADAERGKWLIANVFKYQVWIDLKRNDEDELVAAIDKARQEGGE